MKLKRGFEKLNQDSEPTIIKRNILKYVATHLLFNHRTEYGMRNTLDKIKMCQKRYQHLTDAECWN
jgi:hypothetical protein